jgi:REP element-mobilizing transposase RayT
MRLIWRHVIVNTLGSWLHGDPRGFRSRDHRIHSSGDYKNPPPKGEHEGLFRYQKGRSPERVEIAGKLRATISGAFVRSLQKGNWQVLGVSASATHLHALVKLPSSRDLTKRIIGDAKRAASRRVRKEMPRRIWSADGTYKPVRNRGHQIEAYHYILERQEEGAFVWNDRQPVPE